jgi:integrase
MSKAKATLVARVNDGTATFPFIAVKIARRRIVIPVSRKDGSVFNFGDIVGFYARYPGVGPQGGKRRVEPLGKDPVSAYTRFLQIEQDFSRIRAGLLPLSVVEPSVEGGANGKDDRDLWACAAEFKANLVTFGKKKSTIRMYSLAVDDFVQNCSKRTIDAIDKKDMINHLAWMRANLVKRGYGDSQHTFRNRVRFLGVFFNSFGVKNPLPMKEIKKPMKKRPTRYSVEIINQMLKAANRDEKDLILFLLKTGFRDEETAYAHWSDIDFKQGSINVYAKPEYDWTPKDNEARQEDIVLEDRFLKQMKERKERRSGSGSDLIFPSEVGKPNMHLIKIVQRVAKRAGITDKRITLHAFRRTFGSVVAKQSGIEQARIWLGHSDIETTQRYIAAEEMTTEHSRKMVKEMWSGVGD